MKEWAGLSTLKKTIIILNEDIRKFLSSYKINIIVRFEKDNNCCSFVSTACGLDEKLQIRKCRIPPVSAWLVAARTVCGTQGCIRSVEYSLYLAGLLQQGLYVAPRGASEVENTPCIWLVAVRTACGTQGCILGKGFSEQ